MSQLDDRPISDLVQEALNDVRELARAEIALAKEEAKTIGMSLLVGFPILVAALVLVSLTLSMLVASIVMSADGTPLAALWAASASNLVLAGGGVAFALRRIPRSSKPERSARSVLTRARETA